MTVDRISSRIPVTLALLAALLMSLPTFANQAAAPYMTSKRYNLNHQVTGVIQPSASSGPPYPAIRNTYNSRGQLVRTESLVLGSFYDETVDPINWQPLPPPQGTTKVMNYTYDSVGRKATESVSAAVGGAAVSLTQFTYDDFNQLTCKAVRMNPAAYSSLPASACTLGTQGADGPDRITQYTYDLNGQVGSESRGVGMPYPFPQAYVTNNYGQFNAAADAAAGAIMGDGLLHSQTDANGNTTSMAYDAYARLSSMTFPDGSQELYTYDANGNRLTLRKRDGHTLITYNYDGLNRVTSEVYPASTIPNVYYDYDLRGLQLVARFNSLSGTGLTQTYDGFGRLATASTNQGGTTRTLTYGYDAEGDRLSVQHPDGATFNYGYDGQKKLTSVAENGSTTVMSVQYDAAARPTSLIRGASVSTSSYGYDAVSRVQTLSQDLAGTANDETRTFGYNEASQINSRNLSSAVYSFTGLPAATTNYSVNSLNEYTQLVGGTMVTPAPALDTSGHVQFGGATTTTTPAYDANGNMTSDGTHGFAYDILNRMISGTTQYGTVNLSYDPKGRLFQTSGGASGTTQFLYDGDALVAEYNSSGTVLRRYVHGAGVDNPFVTYEGSTVSAANRRYFHADQQGSIISVADTNGNAIQTNTYDSYGVPAGGNGGRFQYTGQIILADLGLYYYKARIYNPTIGRFMQTDPIGYKDDEDLYSYVGEDPMDRTDPTGNLSFDDVKNFVSNLASDPSFYQGVAETIGGIGLVAAGSAGDGLSGAITVGSGGLAAPVAIPAAVVSTTAIATGTAAAVDGASKVGAALSKAASGTGSYTNYHESGKTYSGKGGTERSQTSGRRVEAQFGDKHVATEWKPSANDREAFKDEAKRIEENGGAKSSNNYNQRESPGKKYLAQDN